jgi:hypothetical protein
LCFRFNWESWRFRHQRPTPSSLSDSKAPDFHTWVRLCARKRLEHLRSKLQPQHDIYDSPLEWWYSVKPSHIQEQDAELQRDAPLLDWLQVAYPTHPWRAWSFEHFSVPHGFWENHRHRIEFCEWLGKEIMGMKDESDWYQLHRSQLVFRQHGGWGLLLRFNGSLIQLLRDVYPSHTWEEWRFDQTPKHSWQNIADGSSSQRGDPALRSFVNYLEKSLHISKLSDWYRISSRDVAQVAKGSYFPSRIVGSIPNMLRLAYPEHKWEDKLFGAMSKQANQRQLLHHIQRLFPSNTSTFLASAALIASCTTVY